MKTTMKLTVKCIIFTLFCTGLWAENTDLAFPILNYVPNAKAIGMGNAYTAQVNGVSSVFFNPSGLASLYHTEVYGTFQKLNFNSTFAFAGLGFHKRNVGTFGFAVNYFGNNNFIRKDDGHLKKGFYPSSQLLFIGGFGQHYKGRNKLKQPYNLDLGISLKFLQNTLFNYTSYGVGFDVGIKIIPKQYTLLKDFLFGFVIQSALKVDEKKTEIPESYIPESYQNIDDSNWYFPRTKLGITYFLLQRNLSLNLDINRTFFIDNNIEYYIGTGYRMFNFLELRAGYYNGYAFGLGFDFKSVSFNSGFNNNTNYGFTGQFDITLKFF